MSVVIHARVLEQLAHESLIHGGLEFEFELVEGLHRREVCDLERHRHAGPLLRLHLLAEHAVEKVQIRRLRAGRVTEDRIKALGHIAEAEPRELLEDAGVIRRPAR